MKKKQPGKKWAFIVNPVAGNGYAGKYAGTVREMMRRHGVDGEVVMTGRKGHATSLAAEYVKKGYTHIAGVGGDGTFSEIAQALVNAKGVTFGAVSAGTGNDFITILGFPGRFTDADWETFFNEHTINMDVGTCNGRYFLNGMGLGFDAQVAAENYKSQSEPAVKKGSASKYWWHIIKTLVLYREQDMQLGVNGAMRNTKSFLNTIAIGRRLAGGFYLTPKAIANDGLLDICMISELPFVGRVKELLSVLRQTHLHDKVVNYFQTDHLTLEFPGEVPSHLDGELYMDKRFEIGILPRRLKIIYNPAGKHYFKNP
jgi:diacylglycerol kinase (ATP)